MEFLDKSIREIHADLVDKKITVRELVEASYNHIKETDDQYKSFITVREMDELEPEIQAAQQMIDKGSAHLLTGVPWSAKDIFVTKGIRTTAASKTLDKFVPPYTATAVQRVNDKGAIMMGKVNLDAFAHGSSTETSDYFTSRNPWDTDRIPGGSSGGSATSVASRQVFFSLGSETGGSIRHPSALTGITGLKATYGRVPRNGVIAMGSSLDCPGPMTRSADDAAILLSVISGQDEKDGTSIPEKALDTDKLKRKDLKGLKIGVYKAFLEENIQEGVSKNVKSAIEKLKELGAEIVEVELLDPTYAISVYAIISSSEVSSNLARFHGTRHSSWLPEAEVNTVYDHFKNSRSIFGFEAKRRQSIGAYTLSKGYFDEYYKKAQKVRTLVIDSYKEIFDKVDAFVAPTVPNIAAKIGEASSDPMFAFMEDLLLSSSTMAGLPGISIPVGLSEDLPTAMQIVAPQRDEKTILEIANVYQQNTDWHKLNPLTK